MTEQSDIVLWVKPEPFNFGALHLPPHSRLGLHNIKKIIAYAKTKGPQGFPRLSYSVWKHIGCNKLLMDEELAWMFFSLCDILSEKSKDHFVKADRLQAKCTCKEEQEKVRSQMSVDTYHFVLLLFIQHLNKISLRSSLIPGEEWPLRTRSPDLENKGSSSGSRSLDEHNHLSFVVSNLTSILELLTNTDLINRHGEAMIDAQAIESLGWLIGGSVDRGRSATPLHAIATISNIATITGYSKAHNAFGFKTLRSWLQTSLAVNPFGVSSCISGGRRLSWPLGAVDNSILPAVPGARLVSNENYAPPKYKTVILSQLCKRTIGRMGSTLRSASVKVHRCNNSFIYLLAPMRSVIVQKCRNSTIVLGAVEAVVQVTSCSSVKIITVCRQLIVSSTSSCIVHVMSQNRPMVLPNCSDVIIAPYHTFYAQLEEHMRTLGLSTKPNLWNCVYSIDKDYKVDSSVWKIIDPKNFYLFSIPFEMPGQTKVIPGSLPAEFATVVAHREEQINVWQASVKQAGLTRQQKKQFQTIVENKFQEWLVETGHKKELDGLVSATAGGDNSTSENSL